MLMSVSRSSRLLFISETSFFASCVAKVWYFSLISDEIKSGWAVRTVPGFWAAFSRSISSEISCIRLLVSISDSLA